MIPLLLLPLAARWSLRRNEAALQEAGGFGKPVRLLQPNIANLVGYDEAAVVRNYRRSSPSPTRPASPARWWFGRRARRGRSSTAATPCWTGTWKISWTAAARCSSTPASRWARRSTTRPSSSRPRDRPLRYDKRHLVPFGEYVPFRGVFGWMDKLARNAGDYRPADDMTLLPWGGEKLGMAICYEVVFPDEVAELVQAGATVLVTITNDAWYGDTSAPWQHLRAARFRAAENRRPLLRAAITGVSAFVAPDGSVRAQLGVYRAGDDPRPGAGGAGI